MDQRTVRVPRVRGVSLPGLSVPVPSAGQTRVPSKGLSSHPPPPSPLTSGLRSSSLPCVPGFRSASGTGRSFRLRARPTLGPSTGRFSWGRYPSVGRRTLARTGWVGGSGEGTRSRRGSLHGRDGSEGVEKDSKPPRVGGGGRFVEGPDERQEDCAEYSSFTGPRDVPVRTT